jgi:hypothetical protein
LPNLFVYLRIIKIKIMNIQKVRKFIELQERANREIDTYGKTSMSTMEMLEEIADSLTPEEIEETIKMYSK